MRDLKMPQQRHPEKQGRPDNPQPKKPDWIDEFNQESVKRPGVVSRPRSRTASRSSAFDDWEDELDPVNEAHRNSVGSDTLNNLMTFWAESFRKHYPNVNIQIEGKGSSTAPPALIAGTANFGPMSRAMKSKEIDEFEKRFGYKPVQLRTSIDMLAIYDSALNSTTVRDLYRYGLGFSTRGNVTSTSISGLKTGGGTGIATLTCNVFF